MGVIYMVNRSLIELKNDFTIIKSNKLNTTQSKAMFIGLLYEMILRKDLFPKKDNLKKFVETVILIDMDNIIIKDYLYKSRSLLAARIIKYILNDFDYIQILKIVNMIYSLIPESEIKISKKNKGNLTDDVISWMKFIGDD